MSRNRYLDAAGVCRQKWMREEPEDAGYPILVEVWRPSVKGLVYDEAFKPQVTVSAVIEVRVFKDGQWWKVGYKGALETPASGQIRRWSRLGSRHWNATIALDGWNDE